MSFPSLILYCRAGFEKECTAEIQERAAALGVSGYCRTKPGDAFVEFVPGGDAWTLVERIDSRSLIFARQLFAATWLAELPAVDRVSAVIAALKERAVSEIFIETADTDEAKPLLALCRKLEKPLVASLRKMGLLQVEHADLPRLHLFMRSSTSAFVGLSRRDTSSPWLMGIPRLRFPSGAPSRSTLKLEEAFLVFLTAEERERRLRPGMRAVDLGAAPGGWTWQLVRRHIAVTAVDNGPMAPVLLESGLVEHRREDGFRYQPRKPVDWMVCDMVEQPVRIARLVGRWFAEGWCRESIFNLKLPMKQRYAEVRRCEEIILQALPQPEAYRLRFKQLYHDRDEVTGHLVRLQRG